MNSYSIRKILIILIIVLITSLNKIYSKNVIELKILNGNIRGTVNYTIRRNISYLNFRGIPYAEPPIKNLRFSNPVKKSYWNGTWDATNDRSECIQFGSEDMIGTTVYGEENCLYINVYTPNLNTTSKLPVLVWIHGGTFIHGNSSYELFGPDFFLEQNLIFVSFNYRLGIFGFFSTEDATCPGNWGIKDQILALKWVQENIEYFGGDPKNVTIFGESAGSVSVHLLLQTNLTAGLFSKAIMNSGTTLNLWAFNTRAKKVSKIVGLSLFDIDSITNNTNLIESLRTLEAEKLQKASWLGPLSIYATNSLRGLIYGPTLEPENVEGAVYTKPSDLALNNGYFHKIPILMGFNNNEAASLAGISKLFPIYLSYFDLDPSLLTPWSMTQSVIKRGLVGTIIKLHYFGLKPIATSSNELIRFLSADQFNRPIRRAAFDMAKYTKVYFYELSYEGEVSGENKVDGTGHAEDLFYLFRSNKNYSDLDVKVSERLVKLWSNFVKFGNPTPKLTAEFSNTLWDPVDTLSNNFTYMHLNDSMISSINPKEDDWQFYKNLWSKYGDGNFLTTY